MTLSVQLLHPPSNRQTDSKTGNQNKNAFHVTISSLFLLCLDHFSSRMRLLLTRSFSARIRPTASPLISPSARLPAYRAFLIGGEQLTFVLLQRNIPADFGRRHGAAQEIALPNAQDHVINEQKPHTCCVIGLFAPLQLVLQALFAFFGLSISITMLRSSLPLRAVGDGAGRCQW